MCQQHQRTLRSVVRPVSALFAAVLFVLFVGDINFAKAADKSTTKDLSKIEPPGGVPLPLGRPGSKITVEYGRKARERLAALPQDEFTKWLVELERIMDQKLEGGTAKQACRTYFVTRMSLAFDDLKWKAGAATKLFQRAQSLPTSEAKVWEEAIEALLKTEIGQTETEFQSGGPAYAVSLVLIPVDALHEGEKYSPERGKKYVTRLKQLTAEDVSLWRDKVDAFGGTQLDAAINLILLDDYFNQETFQRDKFKVAVEAKQQGASNDARLLEESNKAIEALDQQLKEIEANRDALLKDRQNAEPRSYSAASDNSGLLSAPVNYKDTMLIAVTSEGVAAIVFGENVEHGIKYRFRCLPTGQADEIVGEGSVFERYTDGKYDGGQLTIAAGPIRVGWSAGDESRGWVYYEPEKMRLQMASSDRFADRERSAGDQATRIEKLALKRFLAQP